MEEWKEYKLEDICSDIFAGGDAKKLKITQEKNSINRIPVYANSVDKDGLYGYCQTPIVLKPAVTVAARGSGTGFVAYRKEPFVPIVRLITLITKNNVDIQFLYYNLKNRNLKGDGSAIPQITIPMIKKEIVSIPNIHIQRKISGILSSLDNKIELNHRINENLEQQAQALFKSWFVDFEPFKDGKFVDSELGKIPEGWKVVELKDVTTLVTEKVKQRTHIKVLSPISTGELVLSESYFTKQVYSQNIEKYIIVKPMQFAYNPARVNIGSIGMNSYDFDGCVSPVYVVFECEKNYQYFFDCFRKTSQFKEEVISRAIGGVRQSLNYKDFSLIKITYPPDHIIDNFNDIYLSLLKLKRFVEKESQKLSQLRDTFLPRLMSGELEIKDNSYD